MNTNTAARTKFAGLVAQKKRPKKGLLKFLTTPIDLIFSQENIEFDFVTSKRLVSKAKLRNSKATMNGTDVFRNESFKPPSYNEARPYTIDNFRKRVAGQNVYDDAEVKAIVMEKTASDIAELSDKVARAKILQFAYVLQTGKIPFKTKKLSMKGAIEDLDYQCPDEHFSTVSIEWNNASTAVPLTDLENLSVTIQKAYGEAPDTIIMGNSAFQLFLATAQVKDQLENRKIKRGEILSIGGSAPDGIEKDGLSYLGYYIINGKKVGLYSYVDFYIDPLDDTTEKAYIEEYNVCMFHSEARYHVAYAGIADIVPTPAEMQDFLPDSRITEMGSTRASQGFVDTFTDPEAKAVFLRYEEAPLVVPKDYNSFGRLTVKT